MLPYSLPSIKAREIMTRDVTTVGKNDTIEELVGYFKKYDFHSFCVMDKGALVGVVTKTDLLKVLDKTALQNIAVTHVEDIMTPHPVTIAPDNFLQDAVNSMWKNHVRILPVVEDKGLVGLLSYSDLVKTVFKV